MRVIKYIPQYTLNDYQHWEGDWELIDGIAYAMSPSPIRKHQDLLGNIYIQIRDSLKKIKNNCGDCWVVSDVDWIVDDSTIIRPDISVICKQSGDFITSPPVLVIEILSPSTALKDRQIKFEIYREQGVKYYLLADPNTKTFTVYSLIKEEYKEMKSITTFPIHGQCKVEIDVAQALSEI